VQAEAQMRGFFAALRMTKGKGSARNVTAINNGDR
jgi:hypothetical protein